MAAAFEWDPARDEEHRQKQGVAFLEAQLAFLDPCCVIARDTEHSDVEERFYCSGVVRIFGAGYWRRGKKVYDETQRLL